MLHPSATHQIGYPVGTDQSEKWTIQRVWATGLPEKCGKYIREQLAVKSLRTGYNTFVSTKCVSGNNPERIQPQSIDGQSPVEEQWRTLKRRSAS